MCDCLASEEARLGKATSRQIDLELQRAKIERNKELKLLLLGKRGSGKSTLMRQLRYMYGEGYSDAELASFRPHVFRNILTAVKALIDEMVHLHIPFPNKELCIELKRGEEEEVIELSETYVSKLKAFWLDKGVQSCYARGSECYCIPDSAGYYLDSLDRICAPNYIPTIEDVLRIQIATTGIVEYTFQMGTDLIFRIVNVGGLKSERSKWIHCFEDVKAIIFLADISEYNQLLYDEPWPSLLYESMDLFRSICSCPFLQECSIVLFLNKIDLFAKKIEKFHLKQYFADYTDPIQDMDSGCHFIHKKFRECCSSKTICSFFTCATDPECIKHVFSSVRELILHIGIRDVEFC